MQLSPEAYAAIASAAAGVGSAYLNNRSQSNLNDKNIAANRENLIRQLLAGQNQNNQDELFNRQKAYMDTFQQDPVAQQRKLFAAAALGDYAKHGPTTVNAGGVQNPFNVSQFSQGFLTPDALAENAARFYGAAGALNPGAQHADLSGMGFGAAGQARQGQVDNEINAAGKALSDLHAQSRQDLIGNIAEQQQGPITQNGQALDQQNDAMRATPEWQALYQRFSPGGLSGDERKEIQRTMQGLGYQFGPGMEIDSAGNMNQQNHTWRNIGRGLAIGGAGLATVLTAGGASPLLAAAIGAGSGAASGALNGGGWRGALIGGAAGALPGVGSAVSRGIANPALAAATRIGANAGAGYMTGGPRGALMQGGMSALPTGDYFNRQAPTHMPAATSYQQGPLPYQPYTPDWRPAGL